MMKAAQTIHRAEDMQVAQEVVQGAARLHAAGHLVEHVLGSDGRDGQLADMWGHVIDGGGIPSALPSI